MVAAGRRRLAPALPARQPDCREPSHRRPLVAALVKTARPTSIPLPGLCSSSTSTAHRSSTRRSSRRTRERTTAEMLIQNDHLRATDALEEADPARLGPRKEVWSQFMNRFRLPARSGRALRGRARRPARPLEAGISKTTTSRRRRCSRARPPQRAATTSWPRSSSLALPGLTTRPSRARAGRKLVRTWRVGREVKWERGRLALEFEGNRVDLIAGAGAERRRGCSSTAGPRRGSPSSTA